MEKIKNFIKNRKIIFLLLMFAVLSFMPVIGIFSIRLPIWGQALDSVTKKPIQGIILERIIKVGSNGIGGPVAVENKNYIAKTDRDGKFFFGPMILFKFTVPLFAYFSDDTLSANINSIQAELEPWDRDVSPVDKKYYQMGPHPFIRQIDIKYFKNNALELAPKINDLLECKNDPVCIEQNSFDIALKNGDEQLCLSVDKYKQEWDRFNQFKCINIFAIARNSSSVCDLIDKSYNPKYDYTIKREKNDCVKNVERYSKTNLKTSEDLKFADKNNICSYSWSQERKSLCLELIKRESIK